MRCLSSDEASVGVDLSICSVSEAKVELKWIPKVPLLHWLKENAKSEMEKDALVKSLNEENSLGFKNA